jgi:D-glycero-D-manno-heptose 1,7-bisphosphate phosphatase
MGSRPAIFIDRDGTLNELVGFVNHVDAFRLFPWAAEAVRLVNRAGYLAARLATMLEEAGAHLDGIYSCPHGTSGDCECRKPKPGMLQQAERELDVDLSRSYVIGDTYSDIEMAWNAGARGALVLTGYGPGYYEHQRKGWARQPDRVSANLFTAVTDIVWEVSK